MENAYSRRQFLQKMAVSAPVLAFPSIWRSPALRPALPYGVASGDVVGDKAIIWSACDKPAKMWVEWSTTQSFRKAYPLEGPVTLPETGLTSKMELTHLPQGQEIFYRVRYQSLEDLKLWSETVEGSFRTPGPNKNLRFLWSGDTAGQGWGINPDFGGMKTYASMLARKPDFFIHSGDTIYADGPIQAEVKLPDDKIWKNLTTSAKSKVAESLDEFRGNYAYNLMDEHVRRFNAEVPILYQWDDHETLNNWYPEEIISDNRYTEKRVAILSARAKQAFLEYNPIRTYGSDPQRIYRSVPYGNLAEIFMLDLRSYRGANGANKQTEMSAETAFLGVKQLLWLKEALLASKASWKIIASDMPLGLIVYDDYVNKSTFENGANGNGPALGRELEIAQLLQFIHHNDIRNVVWLTADVHYTAAHYYDPALAQFKDFRPFYEFVSGPLNSGTFGPGEMDNTFGPQVLYYKAPPEGRANLSPAEGMQFFGEVNIDAESRELIVSLKDMQGSTLYEKSIAAE